MPDLLAILTFVTACAAGVVGGVFFAFSAFVMKSLSKLPPAQGLTAMQSVNVWVINIPFMGLLFGTALLCMGLAVSSLWEWQRPGTGYRLVGSLIYLVGVIGMTIVFHVPRNDALALLDPATTDTGTAWLNYARVWTAGNHVRTVSGITAMVLLLLSVWTTNGSSGTVPDEMR